MILYGEERYKDELKSLWKLCFPDDSDAFVQFYFDRVYNNEETLIIVGGNKVVSSLQIIPFPIKINSTINLAGYISGAMTHPGAQKKGYMAQLLNVSFKEMKKKGYIYSFLIPQEEWLCHFYGKYGYQKAFPIQHDTVLDIPDKLIHSDILRNKPIKIYNAPERVDINELYIIYSRFLMQKENVILKTKHHLANMIWDLFEDGGNLLYNEEGIAFISLQEDRVNIREFFFSTAEIKLEFLYFISTLYPQKKIIYQNNPNAPFLKYKGMIKCLDENIHSIPDIYMSMMLD